jgi:hypothetical protein
MSTKPALAVHLEISCCPHDRLAHVAREDRILAGEIAHRFREQLRVNGCVFGKIIGKIGISGSRFDRCHSDHEVR